VLANEKEIVDVLKTGNMMNLNVVDFAKMSFGEQMKLMRYAYDGVISLHAMRSMLLPSQYTQSPAQMPWNHRYGMLFTVS
jgi:hypothetical protein